MTNRDLPPISRFISDRVTVTEEMVLFSMITNNLRNPDLKGRHFSTPRTDMLLSTDHSLTEYHEYQSHTLHDTIVCI